MTDEAFFRYSVRCDRERAQAIERAAAKAGLSATSYVQRHFERILDAPAAAPAKLIDLSDFDAGDFARRHDVSKFAARVWAVLAAEARDGLVRMSQAVLAERVECADTGANRALTELRDAGLAHLVERSTRGTLWRISEGEP